MVLGGGPEVTTGGKCTRVMYVGATPHTVTQVWTLTTRGVQLRTMLADKKKGKTFTTHSTSEDITEAALSKLARQKADEIMSGRRKQAAERNTGVPQRPRSKADSALSCPVIAAIRASQKGARTRSTDSSATPSADPPEVNNIRTCNLPLLVR